MEDGEEKGKGGDPSVKVVWALKCEWERLTERRRPDNAKLTTQIRQFSCRISTSYEYRGSLAEQLQNTGIKQMGVHS